MNYDLPERINDPDYYAPVSTELEEDDEGPVWTDFDPDEAAFDRAKREWNAGATSARAANEAGQ